MKDKSQFYRDMAILAVVIIAIYYLKIHSLGTGFNPFDGLMAFVGGA